MPVYKDTKKGTWYAAFYYKDWTGARKHTCKRGFRTQREAKEYEQSFQNQQLHSSDITFANLADNYLDDMGNRLKPTTMANKRVLIEAKLVPYFGSTKIADIDTIMIRKWQNELLCHKGENGVCYKPTYLKSMNAQMSAIMNYELPANPCRNAGTIGKQRADAMSFWTLEQYDLLPDCKIDISKNYQVVKGVEMFLLPKTDKSRRCISIPRFLYDEIMAYIAELWQYKPEDRILQYTRSALDKEIHRVADLAGLPHIRVHDPRHSHVSMLINMKFDIKQISERLGHDSVKTTWDTYSHMYPDTDRELADRLNLLRLPGDDSGASGSLP